MENNFSMDQQKLGVGFLKKKVGFRLQQERREEGKEKETERGLCFNSSTVCVSYNFAFQRIQPRTKFEDETRFENEVRT